MPEERLVEIQQDVVQVFRDEVLNTSEWSVSELNTFQGLLCDIQRDISRKIDEVLHDEE